MDEYKGVLVAAAGLVVVAMYALYLRHLEAQAKNSKPKPAVSDCPDCGGKVSNKAVACPHCGRPMK